MADEIIDFRLERRRHERWFGRDDVFEELERLLPREGATRGWVLVKGGPGMGKSAVLARYVDRLQDRGEQVPHHFLRHGIGDWDKPWRVAQNLAAQVEKQFGLSAKPDLRPEERLREVLQRASDERLVPERKRLLLVVDGLDEAYSDAGHENPLPRMLPHALPPGVQVLCASRPMYPHLSWLEQLERVRELDLDATRWAGSNEAVVRHYWEDAARRLEPPLPREFVDTAARRAQGNILYTVKLAEWLEEQPPERRRVELLPRSLEAFLTQSWERLAMVEGEAQEDMLEGLGLMTAAREALPHSRLAELAGWTAAGRLDRFLRRARPFLLEEPESWWGEKAWRPFHESFRAFMANRLGKDGMRQAHRRLSERLGSWPVKAPGDGFVKRYAVRHGVAHRLEAGEAQEAVALCRDLGYLEALCRESGPSAVEESLARTAEPADGGSAAVLRALQRAVQAESHWLAKEPEALVRLVYNRLLSSGWSQVRFEEALRLPEGLPALRLRHPVRMGSEESTAAGHEGGVRGCAVTRDGLRVLSASEDGTLKVWDVKTGQPLATLRGHRGEVLGCAVTGDGRRAVSASRDGSLKAWDAETGQCIATLYGHTGPAWACAVTEEGRRVVSASSDETLRVWDLETQSCLATLRGHAGWVTDCVVTRDGRRAISASRDGTLRVWDLEAQSCLATLRGHAGWVTGCAVAEDGRRAVSASSDGTLRVWDLETNQPLTTLRGHAEEVTGCAMTEDGRHVISISYDGTLKVWQAETGECLHTLASHLGGSWCCAMTGDGRRAVSGSSEGTLTVWDVETQHCVVTLLGQSLPLYGCALTEDGRRAFSASWDGMLTVWDVRTHQPVALLPNGSVWVMDCAATKDGRRAVSASWDGTLRVWDVEARSCLATLPGHSEDVRCCAVTEDGRRVLSGSSDGTLKVWDVETENCLATLQGHQGWVNGCAVTGDGRRAISAAKDGTLKVWDVETRHCLATLQGHERSVNGCAVTSDGRRIVSASEDGTLKVWDMETRHCLATLRGHTAGVNRCLVTEDGRQVLSVSDDATLRVWDVETQRCLDTLHGVAGFLCIAMARDLICAGDRRGNLWLLEPHPAKARPGRRHDEGHPPSLPQPAIMLGIVIALRDEFRELWQSLPKNRRTVRDEETRQQDYVFEAPGTGHTCVATLIGDMGETTAALQTERLLRRWKPRVTVMLGLAAGIHGDLRVGDVVVATQVDHYLDGAKARPGKTPGSFELIPGGSVYRMDHGLVTGVRNFEFTHPELYLRWRQRREAVLAELLPDANVRATLLTHKLIRPEPELHDAHLASGDIVGAAQEFSTWLRQRDRNLKALDMESAGLMAAAVRHVEPKRTLILRGISDFGDERKSELDATGAGALRSYAMRNAIALLWALLETDILTD
ncbi:AAA family ATPase [Archangium sp.]|uniref:phosphorylase family protein n=1 Tax=Archangium sp. TaxID=1872627 RepID=UPI00389AFBBA